jgi:hypothetical protein
LNPPISMAVLHVEYREPGVVNQNGITGLRRQKKSPDRSRGQLGCVFIARALYRATPS